MARAKHPVPFSLNKLQYIPKTGNYDISESGIIYNMPFELTRNLNAYFLNYTCQTVAEWYKSLSISDRIKVTRTGLALVPQVDN